MNKELEEHFTTWVEEYSGNHVTMHTKDRFIVNRFVELIQTQCNVMIHITRRISNGDITIDVVDNK